MEDKNNEMIKQLIKEKIRSRFDESDNLEIIAEGVEMVQEAIFVLDQDEVNLFREFGKKRELCGPVSVDGSLWTYHVTLQPKLSCTLRVVSVMRIDE